MTQIFVINTSLSQLKPKNEIINNLVYNDFTMKYSYFDAVVVKWI